MTQPSRQAGRRRIVVAVVAAALSAYAGCGGEDVDGPSPSLPDTEEALRQAAENLAFAVSSGDIAVLCGQLARQARQQQGCGTDAEDLGPFLRLGITESRDIRFVEISRTRAVARFPDFRRRQDGSPRPSLRFALIAGEWKVTRIQAG